MAFFESEIVQEEAKRLFTDYQELMKLGSEYGKFDREGRGVYPTSRVPSSGFLLGRTLSSSVNRRFVRGSRRRVEDHHVLRASDSRSPSTVRD